MKNREYYNFYEHSIDSKYYRKLHCIPKSWIQVSISGTGGSANRAVHYDVYSMYESSPLNKMVSLLDEECEDLYTFMTHYNNNLHHIVLAFKDHDDALKLKLGDLGNKLLDCLN